MNLELVDFLYTYAMTRSLLELPCAAHARTQGLMRDARAHVTSPMRAMRAYKPRLLSVRSE